MGKLQLHPCPYALEPCPLCGGKTKLVDYGKDYWPDGRFEDWYAECEKCHTRLVIRGNKVR